MVSVATTGVLDAGGTELFPLGISEPPPLGGKTPDGRDAFEELGSGGVNFMRLGIQNWSNAGLTGQIKAATDMMDAGHPHGIYGWLWLGKTANFAGPDAASNQQLLEKIVAGTKDHLGLGAYKGIDEPHNPKDVNVKKNQDFRTQPPGMIAALNHLKTIDPAHPLVVTHEPISPAAQLMPYRAACDIAGVDIYPVSYPPGAHAETANHDLSLVGDITQKLKKVAGPKPVWVTLQMAWSGMLPPKNVPRFPSAFDERFMAYQAIVNGARGLLFFGGHLKQVMRPIDAKTGWNWTFWQLVLKPLLLELTSKTVLPALVAPDSGATVTADAKDVQVLTRQGEKMLYVIAVRCSPTITSVVNFSGLPKRNDGKAIGGGSVAFEYADGAFRGVGVSGGKFSDWFGPHDVHVYLFPLA
ncbi:MAG TPA: hypothetical protein VLJ76_06310 [Gaiellaceae bacterium]|nr:hypothetical protein [Gaiellaceae bacterium]